MNAYRQPRMFQTEDLPLFSGACPEVHSQPFTQETATRQATFSACPLCLDTGYVNVAGAQRPCFCSAGDKHV